MTTFNMEFDFSSAEQRAILDQVQREGYSLIAYKGATGPNQLACGVPAWFSVPFHSMFGLVTIDYQPQYKLYVSSRTSIAVNTTIQMQSLSDALSLGSAQTFNSNGSFVSGGVASVPPDSLGLFNNRPAGTPPITVGLACLVNTPMGTNYLPFCAFTLNSQSSIVMRPLESILLVASPQRLTSGSVQANVSAPGCTFSFNAGTVEYDLQVMPRTYAITNLPGTPSVNPVSSGSPIGLIVNGGN
ncbi:hypothetical protein [Pseudomonas fontis]|uniref:Uncharacterized protein n=1 Tax=Pseudomonas fontis TaxID=2942633 RepID=A0ABT5P1G8_9PSED|nr:hypothetical protein [Pseudomonas fontis]MDD0975487.1 hypothetical protein [Pseudomonas fontis]MDD0994206.1 hypothetical protein [Pseudomonas fontis]